MKQRFKKQYRHHMLDAKLTINRIKQVGQGICVLTAAARD
jgi:tRNA A-37 threonylcarbamoyl transferase component Bud32